MTKSSDPICDLFKAQASRPYSNNVDHHVKGGKKWWGLTSLRCEKSNETTLPLSHPVIRECRLWFGIPDIKVLVVKRKKKFLMKYANSANVPLHGSTETTEVSRLLEYWRWIDQRLGVIN